MAWSEQRKQAMSDARRVRSAERAEWLAIKCRCGHGIARHADTRPVKTFPCELCRCVAFSESDTTTKGD